jgi:concentrative nucleoside transporter, CNT family
MKNLLLLLVIITGIFFYKPLQAQTTDPIQPREENIQTDSAPSASGTSVILLSKDRNQPFSAGTLFRGLLGMAVLVAWALFLSTNRGVFPGKL